MTITEAVAAGMRAVASVYGAHALTPGSHWQPNCLALSLFLGLVKPAN